jgi:signal transduction histidine kinase
MGVYHKDLLQELGLSGEKQIIERIASITRAIVAAPVESRENTAHALSSQSLEAHWDEDLNFTSIAEPAKQLESRIRQLTPELATYDLRTFYANDGLPGHDRHTVLVAAQLPDESWVHYKVASPEAHPSGSLHLILSTTLMAAAIVLLAFLSVRALTAPLSAMSHAAERLGIDMTSPPLPETGPREVRQAARAFNGMQNRIKKLISDRTQMLAAISHDLRTPITRLKLRAELVEDEVQRTKIMTDLAEMETMIASVLSFIREDTQKEEAKAVDVTALIGTICDDLSDAGHDARLEPAPAMPVLCRPLALKRAITNLIDNAVKYGGRARVSLTLQNGYLRIDIDDNGPGIPEHLQEKVFSPFYRVETSRNRSTGGTGLGLTVARSVISAHGGEIELRNRSSSGLRVSVKLPQTEINQQTEPLERATA